MLAAVCIVCHNIKVRTPATLAARVCSLTDTIWILDLQRDYGEVRGLELYFEGAARWNWSGPDLATRARRRVATGLAGFAACSNSTT
jgi:hypothetical protein